MANPWYRHFFYRKEVLKTTWKLRLLVALALVIIVVLPRGFWARQIGQSLVCKEEAGPSDAILVENMDPNYLDFERAAALQRAGIASRVFVPIFAGRGPSAFNEASSQSVGVLAHVANLKSYEAIPIREVEPISLNAAEQVRNFLNKEHIKSVVVVAPGFRSRRSTMVYSAVLGPEGIQVGCSPVFSGVNTGNWTTTWHGIQQVVEQFGKLQYYRFDVLR